MDVLLDTDVIAARTGDRAAFARLVMRYRGLVSSISLATVGNVAMSEDVAQEVFLAAWRDIHSLRSPSSFLPWLRQLTRHRALDAARGGRRPDRRALVNSGTLEAAVDPRPDAHDALLENERTRAVALGLANLPDDAREVITLYYREAQSIEQVARLLGLREDTAKKRLSRARVALRDEVLAHFADAVEATTPGDDFTHQVMIALPLLAPTATTAISNTLLQLFGKWAAVVATFTWLVGMIGGGMAVLWGLRRDLRNAIDGRERRELRLIAVVAIANIALFGLGVGGLPPRGLSPDLERTGLGIAYTIVFTAVHLGIYLGWYPRAKARRRLAEALADPQATARHTRDDRRARVAVTIACAIVAAILVATWIYR